MMNDYKEDALNVEFRIWSYLDGDSADAERQVIQTLIQTDQQWATKFKELSELHKSLQAGLELEQPSMRFTQNVLEATTGQKILRPVKSYINLWVIRGITAFFITIIGYYFFGILDSIQWSNKSSDSLLKNWHLSDLPSSSVLYGSLLFIVVTILMLIDTLLRRKNSQHTT